ncbi:MAG: class I SAM-dependent methyltransferase [Alphaproteobacteria bacterium]|nr:MAG: class I SAM-dependent methyltransferase [Alphaproteobacteria bacterium]
MTNDFYDPLAPFYHLVHGDWQAGICTQAAALDRIIKECWPGKVADILDVTCGIGTQALGLAPLGYRVTGSDLSSGAVARAKTEAEARGLDIEFHVGDMLRVHLDRADKYDLVMSADNAVTHLLSDELILTALKSFHAALRPGGGCLVTMRAYDQVEKGGVQFHPMGMRQHEGRRWHVYQIWDWRADSSDIYDFGMYFTADDGGAELTTHVMRSSFYALPPARMMALFEEAGFADVRRTDGVYFQPVITGTKAG